VKNVKIESIGSVIEKMVQLYVLNVDIFIVLISMTKSEKLARIYKAIGEEISSEILCDVSPDGETLGDWITETK